MLFNWCKICQPLTSAINTSSVMALGCISCTRSITCAGSCTPTTEKGDSFSASLIRRITSALSSTASTSPLCPAAASRRAVSAASSGGEEGVLRACASRSGCKRGISCLASDCLALMGSVRHIYLGIGDLHGPCLDFLQIQHITYQAKQVLPVFEDALQVDLLLPAQIGRGGVFQ